jgi:ribonuclease P protein component
MRRSADFAAAIRDGQRARRGAVVAHCRLAHRAATEPALVGFVVGRTVGNSVTRHRTVRRLRAVVGARLDRLPPGSATVVRALPPAATASSAELASDVDGVLDRLGCGQPR